MLGKKKELKLAEIIARLWMVQRPTETETGDTVTAVCDLLGDDFTDLVTRLIHDIDPNFEVNGLSR